jgi:hypoxanthine phosphoribosyltransferase
VASSRVFFAHASEAELARILDFYRIAWQYEPRTFPIAWSQCGKPVEFFTPDFYLPEYDLYIELTVANPVRNTRKNRKLRLLRCHHPGINVKLFTRRDAERIFARSGQRAS